MLNKHKFIDGHALLIGVGHYMDDTLSVAATAQEAKDMGEILIDQNICAYSDQQVKVLINEKATKAGILKELDTLINRIDKRDNATTIILLSGHGWWENEYYFLPYETKTFRNNGRLQVDLATTLANKDLLNKIRQIQTRRLVILLNTCFSGGAGTPLSPEIEHLPSLKPIPLDLLLENLPQVEDLSQGRGRVIISSSRLDQRSWIKNGAPHSIFGTHLLAGLRGHGQETSGNTISVLDIFTHLARKVPEEAKTIGRDQNPQISAYGLENFPIAMFRSGRATVLSPELVLASSTSVFSVAYNTANIRKLLREGLTDQELDDLCADYFAEVYNLFSLSMDRAQKIRRLIDYCNNHKEFPRLLSLVKQVNPQKYEELEHTLTNTKPAPSVSHPDGANSPLPDSEAMGPIEHAKNKGAGDTSRKKQTTTEQDYKTALTEIKNRLQQACTTHFIKREPTYQDECDTVSELLENLQKLLREIQQDTSIYSSSLVVSLNYLNTQVIIQHRSLQNFRDICLPSEKYQKEKDYKAKRIKVHDSIKTLATETIDCLLRELK